jgi:iron complex transport system substrate-binding protein
MMKSHLLKIGMLGLIAWLLAACAGTTTPTSQVEPLPTSLPATAAIESSPTPKMEAIQLADGLGREISLDEPAQRIVSLAPSNTEILFAVGAGGQVIGRDEFSDFPTAAQQAANIGGGFGELNMETIVSLQPDLVLAADLTPAEQIEAIEKLGLTVFALPNPVTLDGMYENLKTVGRLTGHSQAAEQLVQSLQSRVGAVQDKVSKVEERPLVFYELDSTDPDAPWTAGPNTFIDTLIHMAGGANLGSSMQDAWTQVSVEELLVQNPDLIVLGDATWGGVTPQDVQARQSWASMQAVQEGKIYTFDDNLVSRPGPRLVDGLEAFAKLFHPELFN